MKRVGIVTVHSVNNFGSALQAYALMKAVAKECKCKVEIVDYHNLFISFTDLIRLLPIEWDWNIIKSGMRTIMKRVSRVTKFHHFVNDKDILSNRIFFVRQARRKLHDDVYICGSDQIWNPYITLGIDKFFFLRFEKEADKKIAYAPSFGVDVVPKCYRKK